MPVTPGADRLNLEAADAYCRYLTGRHYENFSVASAVVEPEKRRDLSRIYAFCRSTDDFGDESPSEAVALARLARWKDETAAMLNGTPPNHPVLLALAQTILTRRMPAQPFLDLIEANVMDQTVKSYPTWPELIRYCQLSAAPVGRMVLRVFGLEGAALEKLSDDVCIGLQLANHAQDVSRDAAAGRRYLVDSDVAQGGTDGAVHIMVERARDLLVSGKALEKHAPLALRLQLALYRLGGLAICRSIEAVGYKTESQRPHVSAATKVSLVLRAALEGLA
ncbi:MAG TPA: squalene/phytoene synthase family protein [Candidatus Baltobacteraceae bacterium]|nr:squalene/phytoene synthase family protein [Candidatus Baltobacteraceae bacterium]